MTRIEVLQPHTANQIAAGEVVERPASVVKELVENAIDAHATAIAVRIEGGGTHAIVVTDNGSGIPDEDCEAAFLRHATSKIRSIDDLNTLDTMGFRGEALASIASVASVTMTTRTSDSDTGTCIVMEHGSVVSHRSVASVPGTSIQVNDLFSSTPARLKFLKSNRTEAGYVGDFMARMILSHPEISFRYLSDDNVIYETYGDGSLYNAIFCIYHAAVADHLIPISIDNGYLHLSGYIGQQELTRPNRSFQSLFVNGRYIRSFPISCAVMRAYDTRLMNGRFPFFVLNLTIAPQEMDVNVHPSKMEVRFTDEQRVTAAVYAACRDTLLRFENELPVPDPLQNLPLEASSRQDVVSVQTAPRMFERAPRAPQEMQESFSNFIHCAPVSSDAIPRIQLSSEREIPVYHTPEPIHILTDRETYTVVGCLFRTYWVVTAEGNVYLIDQHAAHERRLYERFAAHDVALSSQILLLPISTVVTPSEMAVIEQYREELEALGYVWTMRGALRLEISSVPVFNGMVLREEYLHEVLSLLQEQNENVPFSVCRDRIIRSACKHAIKAGEDMSEDEIMALLQEYTASDAPLTCPHGRPIILRYRQRDLEKLFKRIP